MSGGTRGRQALVGWPLQTAAARFTCTVGAAPQLTDDVDGFGDARDDEQEEDHDENCHHAVTDRYPKYLNLRVRSRHAREGQARREARGCLVERSLRAC